MKIPVQKIRRNRMGIPGVYGALVCEFARGLDMQLPYILQYKWLYSDLHPLQFSIRNDSF